MAKSKKKDPDAPYYEKPTPGKPGWNLAKKKASKKSSESIWKQGKGGAQVDRLARTVHRTRPLRTLTIIY